MVSQAPNLIAPEEKTAEAESLTLREASCLHFSEKLALRVCDYD